MDGTLVETDLVVESSAPQRCSFFVAGVPAPKGSWNAFWNESAGRCIMAPQNTAAAKAWQKAIRAEALRAGVQIQLKGPIRVQITFSLFKAKATKREWRYRDIKPDGDKLERLVMDALTGVAWRDDSQVCQMEWVKRYVTAGGQTGAQLTIETMHQAEGLF